MTIIDISWPITPQMTAYKNESSVQYTAIRTLEKDNVRKTGITLDSHTGTHVDAPPHFLSNGATTEQLKLDRIIGNCVVIDMTHVQDTISAEDIEEYDLAGCDILYLKQAIVIAIQLKNLMLNLSVWMHLQLCCLLNLVFRQLVLIIWALSAIIPVMMFIAFCGMQILLLSKVCVLIM